MTVRRTQLPDETSAADTLPGADYVCVFEVPIPESSTRSAQDWTRTVFEGAPPLVRWFIRTGWRFPLRFDLAPPGAPNHVLGCRIIRAERTTLVMELCSPLMTACDLVLIEPSRIVFATLVRYRRPIARPLWSVAAVIHHRLMPYLLARAARPNR